MSSKSLLTRMSREMRGTPTFYYIVDSAEDIEIIRTSPHPSPRLQAQEKFLVCKVRFKPFDHVRWTWFSFLSKECVERSKEKLVREAEEAAEILSSLRQILQSSGNEEANTRFMVFVTEMSCGARKKALTYRLIEALGKFPLPNETIERSILYFYRMLDSFDEDVP